MDGQFSTDEAPTVNSATSHHKAHVRDGGRTVEVRSQSLWQMGAVIYALQGNLRRPRIVQLKQLGLPWIPLCIRKRDTGDAYFQTLQ